MRAAVRYNPTLSGVIDLVDFASERNGERDLNPSRLAAVVETFSTPATDWPRRRAARLPGPRLRVPSPKIRGRLRPERGRVLHPHRGRLPHGPHHAPTARRDVSRLRLRLGGTAHQAPTGRSETDPTSRVPLKLYGQELQADSYAVAHMNAIIHDMEVQIERGDTMINPKFKDATGRITGHDIVVANPMWNQDFNQDTFENDPFDRFRAAGGVTTGKGDWAWLQNTLSCLNERGRAAVVLDTGAVTRGSGSKNEDRERNIPQVVRGARPD